MLKGKKEENGTSFLRHLRFPEIKARINEITDAHDDTFNWVFDSPVGNHQKWPSFTQWLADSNGFYLIQGKAGSGKSTFMKFLFEHATTRSLLQKRDASLPVIVLFHSFWLVGSKLQNGWKGLLASLAFQLVSSTSTLLENCGTFPWRSKYLLSDWSEKELQSFPLNMLSGSKITLCLFIDGLDEFSHEDDVDRLYSLLDSFRKHMPGFKYCLSTRPVQNVLDMFKLAPQLRLQALTEHDINIYVWKTLQHKTHALPHDFKTQLMIKRITSAIYEKADGVFIWVRYVLRNVCSCISVDDDLEDLLRWIEQRPSAVADLYLQMWRVQHSDHGIHSQDAAKIFVFGKHFPMPLFQLAVALSPSLCAMYMDKTRPMDETYLAELSSSLVRRLNARTAGLVE